MLDTVKNVSLDCEMNALFRRVSNFVIRCRSEIEPMKPFTAGIGTFVYKRGLAADKVFAVSARPDFENANLVHLNVLSACGKEINLDFDTAPDAFVKQGDCLSVASARRLDQFMSGLR